jgi:ERCC4-related helicase
MSDIISIKPREYQVKIVETCKSANTLVVLPTGLGKTLIALLLSIHRLKELPTSKVLFLAPTRPLVEQHMSSYREQLPELFAQLEIFTGSVPAKERKKLFNQADIIFSTPQCIANDLRSGLYTLHETSLIIIDEAHRCLKNYSYTQVVQTYKQQSENQRILGLTASPGSDSSKVKEICNHLNIKSFEIRSRESPDVKPYLETLKFEKIEVPFPTEFQEIRVLLKKIYDEKTSKLKSKGLLFGPANKITLLKTQARLAQQISSRNFAAMYGMTLTAQAIKISHALELLETQTLSGLNEYFQSIIEQARTKKSKAVQTLVKTPEFNAALISLTNLLTKKLEHPKIEEVAVIVEKEIKNDPKAKVIIFAQFRETLSTLCKRLNQIPNINSSVFLGQSKKTNSSNNTSGLSQKEQKQVILDFTSGKINVICSTSIGEEGLDIPEVSAVIFYEPIPSAIRKIQRTGRTARLAPGKLFILITKDTRDEINHYASSAREKKMYKTIDIIQKEINSRPPTLDDFN